MWIKLWIQDGGILNSASTAPLGVWGRNPARPSPPLSTEVGCLEEAPSPRLGIPLDRDPHPGPPGSPLGVLLHGRKESSCPPPFSEARRLGVLVRPRARKPAE